MPPSAASPACTTVFFDGSCPLCRREISVYQRATPLAPVAWVDVSASDTAALGGRPCADLMARFHVQTGDGVMLSGAAAFIALWSLFPGWRWLAKFGALPGMGAVLEVMYRLFLRVRPRLQRLFRS
ncbi:thiol-disulfide oxidoreductase DCC family protein [Massilia sp. S19_KUP03_FR1]|uniref:thiol-disulfide oxidoreductase DCC family protein n=1 Tax=Massilia sp. S19_KUP03_FR1 TaxID=3025503 RepID=UPI002FCD6F42